jgi:methionyl-tRNA formyltransferase
MPQDESGATYTRKYTKEDGFIDLTGDPYQNFLKIQAFEGNVGAYFYMNKSTSVPPPLVKEGAGGGFLRQHLRVKIVDADFRDGKLHILRVIPEGKKEMSYVDFLRGMKVAGEAGVKPERADDRAE